MKKWIPILVALLGLTGCAPMENTTSENRSFFTIDSTKGSPFNNDKFQGWGTSLCWWANRISYSDVLTACSEEEKKLVIVAVNTEETDFAVRFSLEGFRYDGGTAQVIRTSQDENWAALPTIPVRKDMLRTTLAPYSITTFVIDNVTIDYCHLHRKSIVQINSNLPDR